MLNIVTIMGRLVADPELRATQSGISVTGFRVAVDRDFVDGSGQRGTDFIRVVAWRGTAEFVCKYFGKGQMIAVNGRIQTRNYEDKDGNKRTAVEIVADRVSFCGSKKEETAPPTEPDSCEQIQDWQQTEMEIGELAYEDLPF